MSGRGPATAIDMERALLNPGSVFAAPEDVVGHEGLTTEQKVEILRRWEYDASEEAVALEEGMPGANGDLLRRILLALERLSGGLDMERTSPTKQHGIPRSAVKPK
jgi:hypothetical protein